MSTREHPADSYQRQYRDVVLETLKAMPSRMQLDAYVTVTGYAHASCTCAGPAERATGPPPRCKRGRTLRAMMTPLVARYNAAWLHAARRRTLHGCVVAIRRLTVVGAPFASTRIESTREYPRVPGSTREYP